MAYIRNALGIVLMLWGLIGFLGDFDFVIEKMDDPGWLYTFVSTLSAYSSGFSIDALFIVVGLLLVIYPIWPRRVRAWFSYFYENSLSASTKIKSSMRLGFVVSDDHTGEKDDVANNCRTILLKVQNIGETTIRNARVSINQINTTDLAAKLMVRSEDTFKADVSDGEPIYFELVKYTGANRSEDQRPEIRENPVIFCGHPESQ